MLQNIDCLLSLIFFPEGVSRLVQMTVSGRGEEERGQEKVPGSGQEEAETPWTQRSQAGPTFRSEQQHWKCQGSGISGLGNVKFSKTEFHRVTDSDRERKMNENLEGVGQILGNLKGMATNMGAEISRQNDQLDVIQGKVPNHLSLCLHLIQIFNS